MCFNRARAGQRGDYIFFGGRIVSVWNNWWGKWVVWYPAIIKKTNNHLTIINNKLRWFAGFVDHNRGRHFDRKRR